MKGAELLVQALATAGVTRIFSLSGNQIMSLYDACIDANIHIVHTRHEAAALFMADAHAQLTGEAGICLVTAAPGAANTLGPLFTARQSESAVVLLTGDSALAQDGKGAFQELDQVSMMSPVTKMSFRAQSPENLGCDVALAVRTSLSGRPGPVHLALPVDVLEADVTAGAAVDSLDFYREHQAMSAQHVKTLLQSLVVAKKPLVLCGPAMCAAHRVNTLQTLENALQAPVIGMQSPRGLKDPSLGDIAMALSKADLIICLGKAVNFTLGFGVDSLTSSVCRWVVIDADAAEIDRAALNLGHRLSMSFNANPADVASQLIGSGIATGQRDGWRRQVASFLAARTDRQAADLHTDKISSLTLCAAVQTKINQAAKETIVISDGGEFGQWSQAEINSSLRLINGPSGAIGGGLCYAIAAKQARPAATVFALMGDGTVGFHLAEFETAVRENTAFVVVIGNDERWNAEHLIQLRQYGPHRLLGCELSSARYDKVVAALGGHGEYVTRVVDLDAALTRAMEAGVVACVNVMMEGLPAPSGSASLDFPASRQQ